MPDFIGDACKAIASSVRGAVELPSFDDDFPGHKNSAEIIRVAVFAGRRRDSDADGKIKNAFPGHWHFRVPTQQARPSHHQQHGPIMNPGPFTRLFVTGRRRRRAGHGSSSGSRETVTRAVTGL